MHQIGKITAVEGDKIWVDVTRQNACNSCAAKNGCGTSLLERAMPKSGSVFALQTSNPAFEVGGAVDISMDEDKIVVASLLIYGLPLLALLVGAGVGDRLFSGDAGAIGGAIAGFGVGFVLTRLLDKKMAQGLNPSVKPISP